MSLRSMKVKDIELATAGINCRTTIQRCIRLGKSTGGVVKHPLERGRPRVLTYIVLREEDSPQLGAAILKPGDVFL